MKVRLKDNLLVVTAESDDESVDVAAWAAARDGRVFALRHQNGQAFVLTDLGPRQHACREPVRIAYRSPDPSVQPISNLAHTPFELDSHRYASVEAFWQGLKPRRDSRNIPGVIMADIWMKTRRRLVTRTDQDDETDGD